MVIQKYILRIHKWTSDGQWLIFRSNRVKGEAMAVNEKTGEIVQVSEGGFNGIYGLYRSMVKV
jgi:oligogalacturonide lyase